MAGFSTNVLHKHERKNRGSMIVCLLKSQRPKQDSNHFFRPPSSGRERGRVADGAGSSPILVSSVETTESLDD
jgi:hypothetical protein